MQFSYLIIDQSEYSQKLYEKINDFEDFLCLSVCQSESEGINKILELRPNLVFLSINQTEKTNYSPFQLISELNEYLDELPTFIVLSETKEAAFEAFQRGVSAYLLKPIDTNELRKCLLRYAKRNTSSISDKICIKSHGDYHFIKTSDIVYLKADNNNTDFYLESGKVISAFKTLKYFEKLLPFFFFRIHHGFIINIDFVSRINLGKSNCYLQNNEIILPFSRTYKKNIDTIILRIT